MARGVRHRLRQQLHQFDNAGVSQAARQVVGAVAADNELSGVIFAWSNLQNQHPSCVAKAKKSVAWWVLARLGETSLGCARPNSSGRSM